MMYNQKLLASLKANGKILREFKDTVYIPFGSEYSILLKNLSTVRCIVNVFVDGDNIVPGGLVITAGQTVDLERSIKNGNLTVGNKLKFIERTGAIENGPRGIKLEDGIVRIEYNFEKIQPVASYGPAVAGWPNGIPNTWPRHDTVYRNIGGQLRSVDYSKDGWATSAASASIDKYCADNNIKTSISCHDGAATMDTFSNQVTAQSCSTRSLNDVGITVAGSKSEQKFSTASWFATEAETHSIVLKLLGETADNQQVIEAVTVKKKPKCTTCGKVNKATAKFCAECGTSLEIFA